MTLIGDWGTSRLRLFRLGGAGQIGRRDGAGIGSLDGTPADTLRATLGDWDNEAARNGILLCGMAGSRGGLAEAAYLACPASVTDWLHAALRCDVAGISVRIAPGLSCRNFAGAPDVMRGEETQIFGALTRVPELARSSHILALPGTHSKWAHLEGGVVTGFHTMFSGEAFALLRDHSVLTRLAGEADDGESAGFAHGLARATDGGLVSGLFEARAAQLLDGRGRGWALGFLSGLILGNEVREGTALIGTKPVRVTLIGDPTLCARYEQAFAHAGIDAETLDGDACVIAGLERMQE